MSRIRIFTITSQDYIDARNILGVLKCTLVIHTHCNCVLTLTSNFEPETFGGVTAIHSQVFLCLQPCHLCFTAKKYTSSLTMTISFIGVYMHSGKFVLRVSKMGTKLYSTVTLCFKTITMKF